MEKKSSKSTSKKNVTKRVASKLPARSTFPVVGYTAASFEASILSGATIHRNRNLKPNQWGIIDPNDVYKDPTMHFHVGVIRNPKFSSVEVTRNVRGCGSQTEKIGTVTGDLVIGAALKPKGVKHFSFKNNQFCDIDGNVINTCSWMQLNSDGSAVYIQ